MPETRVELTGYAAPNVTVNDDGGVVVEVKFGAISSPTSSGNVSFVSSAPGSSDGSVGDIRIVISTLRVYEKTGLSAWTERAQLVPSLP